MFLVPGKVLPIILGKEFKTIAKTTMVQNIENKNLVDDFEMEEIRNNIELRERIRAGKRDAANRKGRFVEMP
jgi:hypothetical protein